jgi:hypothetical protein
LQVLFQPRHQSSTVVEYLSRLCIIIVQMVPLFLPPYPSHLSFSLSSSLLESHRSCTRYRRERSSSALHAPISPLSSFLPLYLSTPLPLPLSSLLFPSFFAIDLFIYLNSESYSACTRYWRRKSSKYTSGGNG